METVLLHEKVWFDKFKYDDAERQYFEDLAKVSQQYVKPKVVLIHHPVHKSVLFNEIETVDTKELVENSVKVSSSVVKNESPWIHEKVWFDKYKYHDAERLYFENLSKPVTNGGPLNIKRTTSSCAPISKAKSSLDPLKSASHPNPVSTPIKLQQLNSSPNPASPPIKPQQLNAQPPNITNIKTKTVVIASDNTENIQNNKNKEKRFRVKERHRNKKKLMEEEKDKIASGNNQVSSNNPIMKNTLADEVAKARQHIQNSLECVDGIAALTTTNNNAELLKSIRNLEIQNKNLQDDVSQLKDTVAKLSLVISGLEKKCSAQPSPTQSKPVTSAPICSKPAQPTPKKPQDDDDDDGVDLFGSDSEEDDEEAKKVREQRLAEYASRKSNKPVLIAKSNIILDVKPWSDETNMQELENSVRKVTTDGLVWGASKLVPLAYGIHKLQISCVVEDDKVSVDWLQETIQEITDHVQSVDIAAFNKV